MARKPDDMGHKKMPTAMAFQLADEMIPGAIETTPMAGSHAGRTFMTSKITGSPGLAR